MTDIKEILAKLKAEELELENKLFTYVNGNKLIINYGTEWYSQWKEKYGKEVEEYFKAYKAKEAEDKCSFNFLQIDDSEDEEENATEITFLGEFHSIDKERYYFEIIYQNKKTKIAEATNTLMSKGQIELIIEALTNALKIMKD